MTEKNNHENNLPPNLAKPAQRALDGAGITSLEHVTELNEAELMKLHGMGPKAMNQLRVALEEKGLSFAKN
jgi:DNA-directed RNA polymerase alpha subunit